MQADCFSALVQVFCARAKRALMRLWRCCHNFLVSQFLCHQFVFGEVNAVGRFLNGLAETPAYFF
jgi:hypothetical protein